MTTDLESIKQTLVSISRGDGVLDTLLEFERTLDNVELFAYKNWILGELVQGPDISRYWYTVTFMYPYSMMPDPAGGLRLTKIGAKVSYEKGVFNRPIKVTGPMDWADPQSKRAKMVETEIWLVRISLPLKYINYGLDQSDSIIQQDIQKANGLLSDQFEEESIESVDGAPADEMEMTDDTGMEDEMGDEGGV